MLGENIYKIRKKKKMSQEEFAEIFHVSRQAVQKWENGSSMPEITKLAEISKYFGISIDALVLNRDSRMVEETNTNKEIKPMYESLNDGEFYSSAIKDEYIQSIDEGLDIKQYKDLFDVIALLPKNEIKNDLGNVVQKIILNAPKIKGYKYIEPSDLEGIRMLRKEHKTKRHEISDLEGKVAGAWFGRICGCMLGKTVEGIRTNELVPFLKESGNYPMHRYILKTDINDDVLKKYTYAFADRCYIDEIGYMPADDDTNYTVLSQVIIEKYGRNFKPQDVAAAWLDCQPKNAYWTAERIAYCNFVKGYLPPQSALHKNPYREWIGAQIRGDYWGYINPGNPEAAAEMAWRDASISHVKNGIYGEMFVSAMLAEAACCNNTEDIILAGISQIPHTSRLYEDIANIVAFYREGRSQREVFSYIHERYDEYTGYGWCHTNSNAMIVAAALLYGNGDYGKSICMAVETGFDTDCNGATVGSIVGMAHGINNIPKKWTEPLNNTLETSIFGMGKTDISERIKITMKDIAMQ